MNAVMTHDVDTDGTHDAPEPSAPSPPELVLVETEHADSDEPRRLQASRRRPPLPTLHLDADESLDFPAA